MDDHNEQDISEESDIHDSHGDSHAEGHEEPWLVSYADMMTLLFGFFVLMYTFAMARLDEDPDKMVKMREEVAKYFGGDFITPMKDDIDEFKHKFVEDFNLSEIETKITPEGVEISFRSNLLFDLGEATLKDKGQRALKALTKLLMAKENVDVIVEGHTDDIPLRKNSHYRSNWELGGSRAASVIELLVTNGMNPQRVRGISFADTRPLAPNRDSKNMPIAANQARNRRVTIKIASMDIGTQKSKKPVKLSPKKKI